jgi:hypothetical protein
MSREMFPISIFGYGFVSAVKLCIVTMKCSLCVLNILKKWILTQKVQIWFVSHLQYLGPELKDRDDIPLLLEGKK